MKKRKNKDSKRKFWEALDKKRFEAKAQALAGDERDYSDVTVRQVINLDTRLANIISKHLHAFLKVQKSEDGGTPGILVEKYGEEKADAEWLNIIRKMIHAFDDYCSIPDYQKTPEIQDRIKEGMQLFIDYFKYFWI